MNDRLSVLEGALYLGERKGVCDRCGITTVEELMVYGHMLIGQHSAVCRTCWRVAVGHLWDKVIKSRRYVKGE